MHVNSGFKLIQENVIADNNTTAMQFNQEFHHNNGNFVQCLHKSDMHNCLKCTLFYVLIM